MKELIQRVGHELAQHRLPEQERHDTEQAVWQFSHTFHEAVLGLFQQHQLPLSYRGGRFLRMLAESHTPAGAAQLQLTEPQFQYYLCTPHIRLQQKPIDQPETLSASEQREWVVAHANSLLESSLLYHREENFPLFLQAHAQLDQKIHAQFRCLFFPRPLENAQDIPAIQAQYHLPTPPIQWTSDKRFSIENRLYAPLGVFRLSDGQFAHAYYSYFEEKNHDHTIRLPELSWIPNEPTPQPMASFIANQKPVR